jgi:hypothetical protein
VPPKVTSFGAPPKGTSFGAPPKGTSFGAPPKGTSFGAHPGYHGIAMARTRSPDAATRNPGQVRFKR